MKLPYALPLALLAACGGSTPTSDRPVPPDREVLPPDAAPPPPDAPPPPALSWTVDGKPMSIGNVIAAPDGDNVMLQITNDAYPCEDWVAGYREHVPDDELTIGITLHPNLAPDGTRGWAITGTAFQDTTSSAQDGGDPVPRAALDPSAGGHSRLDISLDLDTMDDPPRHAHLEGPIDALGCGPLTWMGSSVEALPPALPGAVLKVAGQDVPVGGAMWLVGDSGRQLMLASEPITCVEGSSLVDKHHFLSASRADVTLELTWQGTATDHPSAELGGELLGKGGSGYNGVDLSATPTTAKKGAKKVSITLGGSTTIGDYAVELSGTVDATICR